VLEHDLDVDVRLAVEAHVWTPRDTNAMSERLARHRGAISVAPPFELD
jgi:hypothetical protein